MPTENFSFVWAYGAVVFPMIMLVAAVNDVASYKIPNRLTLILIGAFLIAAFFAQLSLGDVAFHVGIAGLALGFGMFAFAMRWMGGGDGKFLAACALWFGPRDILSFVLAFSILGGGLALLIMGMRLTPLPSSLARYRWLTRLWGAEYGVPYALAFAGGGLLVYPQSDIWHRLVLN